MAHGMLYSTAVLNSNAIGAAAAAAEIQYTRAGRSHVLQNPL